MGGKTTARLTAKAPASDEKSLARAIPHYE